MTTTFTVSQIQQQNVIGEAAYHRGELNAAQYQQWKAFQTQALREAQAREAAQRAASPLPASPWGSQKPTQNNWQPVPLPPTPPGYTLSKIETKSQYPTSPSAYWGTTLPKPETVLVATYEPTNKEPKSVAEQYMESKPIVDVAGVIRALTGTGNVPDPFGKARLQTQKEFVGGAIASGENIVYVLPKLAGVKGLPETPPTLTGGVIGKGIQGGASLIGINAPSTELEETIDRGPAYAAGSVLGDVLISIAFSEGVNAVVNRIRGVKVTKLAGGQEMEVAKGTGKTLETSRIMKLTTESQRVSPGEAAKLQEFARYVQPKKVLLGGTQLRAENYIDDTFRVISGGAESIREASPIVETAAKASSTQSGLLRKIAEKVGISKSKSVFTGATVKEFTAKGETFSSKIVGVASKGKGFVTSTEKITSTQALYPYGSTIAKKTFTGVIIEGTIDTQTYLSLVKAVGPEVAQRWYPQMGGVSVQLLEKAAPKAVTLTTKVVGIGVAQSNAGKIASSILSLTPQLTPKAKLRNIQVTVPFQETKPKQIPQSTTLLTSPKPSTRKLERVSPYNVQAPSSKQSPITATSISQSQKPKQVVRTPAPMVTPATFNIPTSTIKLPPAALRLGGSGGGRSRQSGYNIGKWFFKRNPVATAQQNLKTVLGSQPKRLPSGGASRRKLTQSFKLGRGATVRIKGFKRKSKRKKKRGR